MHETAHTTAAESPPDILLLLRAHAEQHWLTLRVLPLVRQLEPPCEVPEEEVGAALSYLEVMWLEAGLRAGATEAAAGALTDGSGEAGSVVVAQRAHRYHAAVRRLRQSVDRRVRALTCAELPLAAEEEPASS